MFRQENRGGGVAACWHRSGGGSDDRARSVVLAVTRSSKSNGPGRGRRQSTEMHAGAAQARQPRRTKGRKQNYNKKRRISLRVR